MCTTHSICYMMQFLIKNLWVQNWWPSHIFTASYPQPCLLLLFGTCSWVGAMHLALEASISKSTPSARRSVNKSYCSCPHWFKPEEKDVRTGRHVKFLLANWSIKRCVTKETLAFLVNKKRSTSERINYIPTSKQMSTACLTRCYLGKGHIEALLDRFHDIEIFEFEGSNSARCLNLLMVVPCATQSHTLTQTPSVGAESQFVRRSASLTSLVLLSTKCI
jgi:hypothetical protein